MGSTQDFSHLQDVLGSYPMLKRYTVICLCFCLAEDSSIDEISNDLRRAAKQLSDGLPYLAGRVIYEGRDETHSGRPRVIPHKDTVEVIVSDLTMQEDAPSMSDMQNSKYPFRMLDPDVLLPPISVSWSTDPYDKIAPVLLLQANFITGGLLLTFSINHAIADMTGFGGIIAYFAKACRQENFTQEELKLANQDRTSVIPLLSDAWEPGTELDDSLLRPSQLGASPPAMQPARWCYFNFSETSLRKLKQKASLQTVAPYISTDDALGALCWQRITKVRGPRLIGVETQFARPISVRKHFGLTGYLGHTVDCVYSREVDVWEKPIGDIAGGLRQILQQEDRIKHHARALATMVSRLDDKTSVINGAQLDPSRDISFSSYANIRCCELSFGSVLGRPEAARRPNMPTWPSLLYMMPRARDASIALGVCLAEDELVALSKDDVFMKYAEYVG